MHILPPYFRFTIHVLGFYFLQASKVQVIEQLKSLGEEAAETQKKLNDVTRELDREREQHKQSLEYVKGWIAFSSYVVFCAFYCQRR